MKVTSALLSAPVRPASRGLLSSATRSKDTEHILRAMLESRECDAREVSLMRQGKGWYHMGASGHEALGVLARHLGPEDYLALHYRDRALLLARGVPLSDVAHAFFGRQASEGCGKQMSSHFSARAQNIWSFASPIAAHLLPACGLAWSLLLRQQPGVVLASLGEGGSRQGEFYEAFCFALERWLPMVFVVEDNELAISTRTGQTTPMALGVFAETRILRLDGRDVETVDRCAQEAIAAVRAGEGPRLLWCDVDRLGSHTSNDDHTLYRSPEEIETIWRRDPCQRWETNLISHSVLTPQQIEQMRTEARERVKAAYSQAEAASLPTREDTLAEVLGPPPDAKAPSLTPAERGRMADAVNAIFRRFLAEREDVLFFGEDIEDPKGGVFRLTKGLSTAFPGRVVNSPLAEATIVGVGCGLAAAGLRPIFELQFIDFAGLAWNQLVNNVATLRWRTQGRWKCPLLLYAPCGAYLPAGGMWHSQCSGSALAQHPGLRVVMPSTPDDAAALFWTAVASEDPTVVLLPKHLLWKRHAIGPAPLAPVPFGQARSVRAGSDATVVCWGNCVELAEAATVELGQEISLEILDLRSLVPWDRDAVARSLAKTGRLLVVQEENESCSLGQMIVSWVVSESAWNSLLCQPVLVSRPDVHVGFHPVHEEHCLPTVPRIVDAARRLVTL